MPVGIRPPTPGKAARCGVPTPALEAIYLSLKAQGAGVRRDLGAGGPVVSTEPLNKWETLADMRPHPFGNSFDELRTNGWGRGPPI